MNYNEVITTQKFEMYLVEVLFEILRRKVVTNWKERRGEKNDKYYLQDLQQTGFVADRKSIPESPETISPSIITTASFESQKKDHDFSS